MSETSSASVHGDVVPRLAQLIVRASEVDAWGIRVTQKMVSRATDRNYKTIHGLYKQKTTLYDLTTLGRLCWFFSCDVGDVLSYIPARGQQQVVPIHIRRLAPPQEKFPEYPLIQNLIPLKLSGIERSELATFTGLTLTTIGALQNREHPATRIPRHTLAVLVHFLSQIENRSVNLGELLQFQGKTKDWRNN